MFLFRATMLSPLEGAQTWRLYTKLYKFGCNIFLNNAGIKNRTDLLLGEVFYIYQASIIFLILDLIN